MDEQTPTLDELEKQIFISKDMIENIIIPGFSQAYRRGFDEDESTMIPSYVCRLPTGMETGTYLALDVGGTNLRVAAVTLLGDGKFDMELKHYVVPESLKTDTAESFFNWVADCTKNLLDKLRIRAEKEMRMGVTFSFPIKQTDINKGVAMKMGKGFNISGLVNHDVVELLHAAYVRKGLNIYVAAIVNDAVGTLVAHAYKDQNTIASMIIGTGINAACICETSEIKKQQFPPDFPQYMIINNEISIMGSDFLQRTKYDKVLDSQSAIPGFQPFEKMVSGLYMGELVRLAIVDYVENCNLFNGKLPEGMEVPYSFTSILMSDIESDRSYNSANILKVLKQNYKFPEDNLPTVADMRTVQEFIRKFSRRSAQLSAAAAASLIQLQCGSYKEIEREIKIAVDGSIYHSFFKYATLMNKVLRETLGPQGIDEKKVKLSGIKNGGCIGAAVVAMMYSKTNDKKKR